MFELYNQGLLFLEKNTDKFNIKNDDICIISAGDSNVFGGIQALYLSLKNKCNFICYDIGFTEEQIKWANDNGLILKYLNIVNKYNKNYRWQTWLKSYYIDQTPYEYVLWIDSDCIVVGDLSISEFIKNKKTFFMKHWIKQPLLKKNTKELYEKYPVKELNIDYLNAGII
jgi:hypothetical protein